MAVERDAPEPIVGRAAKTHRLAEIPKEPASTVDILSSRAGSRPQSSSRSPRRYDDNRNEGMFGEFMTGAAQEKSGMASLSPRTDD